MISLEFELRAESLPILMFWQVLHDVYVSPPSSSEPSSSSALAGSGTEQPVRGAAQEPNGVRLLVLEDSEAVLNISEREELWLLDALRRHTV